MSFKNIVKTMREKERYAILDEDRRIANRIYDQTKLAKTVEDEKISERDEMKGNISYAIERKFNALEQAIKEELNALESGEGFNDFNKVIAIYNNLSLFLNKIVNYNLLNQNDKIKIDKRFDELNEFIKKLLFIASSNSKNIGDLQQLSNNIEANNYKMIGLTQITDYLEKRTNSKKAIVDKIYSNLELMKEYIDKIRNGAEKTAVRALRKDLSETLKSIEKTDFNLKENDRKIEEYVKTSDNTVDQFRNILKANLQQAQGEQKQQVENIAEKVVKNEDKFQQTIAELDQSMSDAEQLLSSSSDKAVEGELRDIMGVNYFDGDDDDDDPFNRSLLSIDVQDNNNSMVQEPLEGFLEQKVQGLRADANEEKIVEQVGQAPQRIYDIFRANNKGLSRDQLSISWAKYKQANNIK